MQTSKFQYIFLAFLIVAIIGAVFIFSQARSGGPARAQITIWGTLPSDTFNRFVTQAISNDPTLTITYIQKKPETFDQDFVEALASGKGPDVALMPLNLILRHRDKIYPIPYTSLSERTFKDTYIQEAELYLTPSGILSLPFSVDPLVMYWNRDIFTNASVSTPPRYWGDLYDLAEKLTVKDAKLTISKATIALGAYSNVTHAKEILSTLFLQAGTPIVSPNEKGNLEGRLGGNNDTGGTFNAAQSALDFYTEFANPTKPYYSWNMSLAQSKDAFLAGDLAIYIGYASENDDIRQKNPNLNYDVTYIPQSKGSENKITYGNMLGFAIVKTSPALADAFTTVYELTSQQNMAVWQQMTTLPPVRRDMLASIPTTGTGPIFYNSALWSRGWLDPNPERSDSVFQEMIENVETGRSRVADAVQTANNELNALLAK